MSVTHPDSVTFEKSFAALPLATYEAGETVKRTSGLLCQRRPAMKEIFLSYSRPDSSTVQALAAALEEKGVSVWIDRSGIEEGDAYDTQIEEAIAQTRVVIVVWSQHSVRSHWVRAEAAYALSKHKLLPIAIDKSEPPLQFHHIQTIGFDGWNGAGHDEAFTRLLTVLAKRLDRASTLGEPAQCSPAAWWRRVCTFPRR